MLWVFSCGMKRSGSTLHYQLAQRIVKGYSLGKSLGYVTPKEFPELMAKHRSDDQYLVVKCHDFIPEARELNARGEAKAIYIYRDIRDVMVSIMNKNRRSFWYVISRFLQETLDDHKQWSSLDNLLISRYEDVIDDLPGEVMRIARYLNVELDPVTASEIAGEFSLEQQRQRIKEFAKNAENENVTYSPETLLHPSHIISGAIGQWQTALSPWQVSLIENYAYSWLVKWGYPVSQDRIRRKLTGLGLWPLYFVSQEAMKVKQRFIR